MTAVLSQPVLVLDRDFQATRVASVRNAIMMLYKGTAEAVDVEDTVTGRKFNTYDFDSWEDLSEFRVEFEHEKYKWIRSVNRTVAAPWIVRLLDHTVRKRHGIKLNRHNLFSRDGFKCQYCCKKFASSSLTIDHVIPKSRGGSMVWGNVVCACVKCNTKKGSRSLNECGMRLIRKPEAPKHQFPIPRVAHASWANFVDIAYWCVPLVD